MTQFTEEQLEVREFLNACSCVHICALKTLRFLEKELGKVHRVTVDYRKGIYQEAMQKMYEAHDKAHDCGLIDVLIQRLNEKE